MESHLGTVVARVLEVRGLDLSAYRRPMLLRRLAARTGRLGISDATAYVRRLESDPRECDRLIDAVGINVSSFFRNPLVFEIIREEILAGGCDDCVAKPLDAAEVIGVVRKWLDIEREE